MASWFDLIVFALTAAAFVGAIYGVKLVADQISSSISATKESLKNRGLTISDSGVSVRTSSRFNREDYVDATQRGFIKAMNASSFATADNVEGNSTPMPVMSRSLSGISTGSNSSEKTRKHRFSLRKKNEGD